MSNSKKYLQSIVYLSLASASLQGATFTVSNTSDSGPGSFRNAITQANANSNSIILFATGGTCSLSSSLPSFTTSTTINLNGNTFTVSGQDLYQALNVANRTVSQLIVNGGTLNVEHSKALGANGANAVGGGGGGGAGGLGGGIYVGNNNTVVLSGVVFDGCTAQGGNGGFSSAGVGNGGQGALSTPGGAAGSNGTPGRGGANFVFKANISPQSGGGGAIGNAGSNASIFGNGGGGGGSGGVGGGGGGGAGGLVFACESQQDGFSGSGGTGGNGGESDCLLATNAQRGASGGNGNAGANGGNGNFGGGGAGGGAGGPGGGGGGGGSNGSVTAGASGGAGGVGSAGGSGGKGGFGGGAGGSGSTAGNGQAGTQPSGRVGGIGGTVGGFVTGGDGGGGAGLGGAVFIAQGGILQLNDGSVINNTNQVIGGSGANAGLGLGQDIFIQSGGQINFAQSGTVTINNPIVSDQVLTSIGGVVMSGSGILNLYKNAGSPNVNTYSGSTTINNGTVQVVSDLNLGSTTANHTIALNGGTLEIVNGGATAFNSNRAVTVANSSAIISNSTHLSIFNNSVTATLPATLTVSVNADEVVFNGSISGPITFIAQGPSTVAFGGSNTYTGTTSIRGGAALQINNRRSLPQSSNVANNGVLTFAHTGTATVDGVISGSGSVANVNTGTLVLNNPNNSYSGGTLFENGTIEVTQDGQLGAPAGSLIFNGGTLFITHSNAAKSNTFTSSRPIDVAAGGGTITAEKHVAATFNSTVTGSGDLHTNGTVTFNGHVEGLSGTIHADTGLLTITDSCFFSAAPFMVNAADLVINGTVDDTVTAMTGALVLGTGTVNSQLTLNSGSTLEPGNFSLGTLTVAANVTQMSGSTFQFQFGNANSSLLNNTVGTYTIQPGTVFALNPTGLTVAQVPSWTAIQSPNPIAGTFGSILNPLTRYTFSLNYDDPSVVLVLDSVLPFSAFVTSGNPGKVASCFDELIVDATSCVAEVLAILDQQTPTQMQKSFNQMQPANFNNIAFAEENVAERIRQIYTAHFYEQRVASCPEPGAWRLWAAPFFERARQHGNSSSPGYKEQFAGFSLAADYQWQKHWAFTGGFSFASSDMSVPHGKTHASFVTYAGSLAAAWTDTHWYADAVLGYLFSPVHAKRKMHFAVDTFALDDSFKAKAKHTENSNQILSHLGGGYNFKIHSGTKNTVNIYPFANLDYIWMTNGSYTEGGARCMDLKVKSKQYDLLRPEGGLGIGYVGCLQDMNVMFDTTVSYVHEFRFMGKKTKSSFKGNSCTMDVTGLKPANNLVCPSARLRLSSNDARGYSFSLGYHGEYGEHFALNAGEAEIRKAF